MRSKYRLEFRLGTNYDHMETVFKSLTNTGWSDKGDNGKDTWILRCSWSDGCGIILSTEDELAISSFVNSCRIASSPASRLGFPANK